LEVRDNEHAVEVNEYLENVGYHIEREGVGEWRE
jgi:hypothetical protein